MPNATPTTREWVRIDKQLGIVQAASSTAVWRAASGFHTNVPDVIASGRFMTPFAIYSRSDHLTPEDLALMRPRPIEEPRQ